MAVAAAARRLFMGTASSVLAEGLVYYGHPLSCSELAGLCRVVGFPIDGPTLLFTALVCMSVLVLLASLAVRCEGGSCLGRHDACGCVCWLLLCVTSLTALRPSSGVYDAFGPALETSLVLAHRNATAEAAAALEDVVKAALPPFLQMRDVDPNFYARSVEAFGDPAPFAGALERARRRRSITVAVIGGSASNGGGCPSCTASRAKNCGPCYQEWLARWLRGAVGAGASSSVHIVNGAVGGTGPAMSYLCLESLLHAAASPTLIDLVVIEYGINADYDCAVSGPEVEALLWRVKAFAPHAALLLLHAYSRNRHLDAAPCLTPVAQYYGIGAVSWKQAVAPLLDAGTLELEHVMEEPIWHHPNPEGHRQIASLLAHFLLSAARREQASRAARVHVPSTAMLNAPSANASRVPLYPHTTRHAPTLADGTSQYPSCMLAADLAPSRSTGWWREHRGRWWAGARANATLELRFRCRVEGCGVALGVSTSYFPLGSARVTVDDVSGGGGPLIIHGASESHRAKDHKATTSELLLVVAPCVPSRGRCKANQAERALAAGEHTLHVVATGTTVAAASTWARPAAYQPHEFHVRSLVVLYSVNNRAGGLRPGAVVNVRGQGSG